MDILPYLKLAVEKHASDLYFVAGSPVRLKIEGQVVGVGKTALTPEQIGQAGRKIMSDLEWAHYQENKEIDFALSPEGLENARFRVNAYHSLGSASMVMRYIKTHPPLLEDLRMPELLKDLITPKRGLIIMCGATNSGKSTTLAAMLDYRNRTMAGHILTIEDPVEYLHPHQKSIVSQRELGLDTHSYANALRSATRESPDVILIGEIRDQETMEAALELSNTGHLAISTLHANNAYQAIQRVLTFFPHERHKEVYLDISLNLVAILSQRLVMGVDNKRAAALEIMANTALIADRIRDGRIDEIPQIMRDTKRKGMQTFDDSLLQLYREGRITLEEAKRHADSATDMEVRVNFSDS